MNHKMIEWLLLVDEDNIIKRTTVWNLITSLINAGYSAVLMFLIGRFVGMDQVGIFSLATAYAYQCQTIGAFGVRNVQASDVKKEFSFGDYLNLRICSSIIMYCLLIYYACFQGYDFTKLAIILLFGIFKSIEAVEDLFHGEYHRYNRLDIGSILQAIRFIITLVIFALILLITKDLILALFISTAISIFVCVIENAALIRRFVSDKLSLHLVKLKQLLFICLPICISNYISTYIVNLPKYTIDEIASDTMQSVYGILILPVVAINMLAVVVYRPIINRLSCDYHEGNYKMFFREIVKQLGVILILTLIVIIGGVIIGLNLLGLIYDIELQSYMIPFVIMLIGGGVNTAAAFFTVVLTVQRAQNQLLIVYLFTACFGIVIAKPLILQFGMLGTALLYLLLSLCMSILFLLLIYISYCKQRNTKREGKVMM